MDEEAQLDEIADFLSQLTSQKRSSTSANLKFALIRLERKALICYMVVLVITFIVAISGALLSRQEDVVLIVRDGLLLSLALFAAYTILGISNAYLSSRVNPGESSDLQGMQLNCEMKHDWRLLKPLLSYQKHMVEYAIVQYKWRWDILDSRVGLFSGDIRKLGIAPALAASAVSAASLIKQDASLLLWAPIVMAPFFYITGFTLLASRERPRQVVELLSYLIKYWDVLQVQKSPVGEGGQDDQQGCGSGDQAVQG